MLYPPHGNYQSWDFIPLLGVAMIDLFGLKVDKIWCATTQLPASMLSLFSQNSALVVRLAWYRIFTGLSILIELMGYFFITLGLASSQTALFLLVGVLLKVGGSLLSAFFQNQAGVIWSIELQNMISVVKTHDQEVRTLLAAQGCTENEINNLANLPTEIYQSELNSYQRTKFLNLGAPLSCGLGLLFVDEFFIGFIIILLGLLSFPLGERFFKEHTFRHESQMRIARSANAIDYLKQLYFKHIYLTFRVNFLSQLPLILFCIKFLWSGLGGVLASFYGLTQGLVGLSNTLAFQRIRVASIRSTQTASHLIQALASPTLIITLLRWQEHCARNSSKSEVNFLNFTGIALDSFSSHFYGKEDEKNTMPALTIKISSGHICLLQAPSGYGKSTLLMAINHLIEHSGDLLFVTEGKIQNAHAMSQVELQQHIFYLREENIEKSVRLVDLFRDVFTKRMGEFLQSGYDQFGSQWIELALNAHDNLVEQEILQLQNKGQSVFPSQMCNFLIDLRTNRYAILKTMLKNADGNLASPRVKPERTFSTLSSGEKRRLLLQLAYETVLVNPLIKFVILDEPLAHLDRDNARMQLKQIQSIQSCEGAPALLIISHHHIDEIEKNLSHVMKLNLSEAIMLPRISTMV